MASSPTFRTTWAATRRTVSTSSAAYSHGLGQFGGFTASFQGTWVNNYKVDNGLTQPYDCVGLYGSTCGSTATAPVPKWRHKLRLTWDTPLDGLGLSGQWRHQSGVTYEGYSTNPTLAGTHYSCSASEFPAFNYFDLGATYSLFDDAVSLRAGVNNIFDKIRRWFRVVVNARRVRATTTRGLRPTTRSAGSSTPVRP